MLTQTLTSITDNRASGMTVTNDTSNPSKSKGEPSW